MKEKWCKWKINCLKRTTIIILKILLSKKGMSINTLSLKLFIFLLIPNILNNFNINSKVMDSNFLISNIKLIRMQFINIHNIWILHQIMFINLVSTCFQALIFKIIPLLHIMHPLINLTDKWKTEQESQIIEIFLIIWYQTMQMIINMLKIKNLQKRVKTRPKYK